jgi:hypothetical protein
MNMSLDDFIRRQKAGQSNVLKTNKKAKEDIDKDELDVELDQIAAKNYAAPQNAQKGKSTLSKFERLNLSDTDDDDNNDPISTQNSSIEFAKKIEQMEHPHCCKFKPFRTIEDKTKVKIRSQQWRLGGNSDQETANNTSGVRNGRVGKNYRNNNNLVRGNFTYQKGDNGVAGIVRNNRQRIVYDQPAAYEEEQKIFVRKTIRPPGSNQDMQVNFDITNLVRTKRIQINSALAPPPPTPAPIKAPTGKITMGLETDDLIEFLKFRKSQAAAQSSTVTLEAPAAALSSSTQQVQTAQSSSATPSVTQYARDAFGEDISMMDDSL